MSEFDPAPWIAALGLGGGTGVLGWVTGRRKSKADAALVEAQSVSESLKIWQETVIFQGEQIAETRAELKILREEMKTARSRKAQLVEYVDGAWSHYDAGAAEPWPLGLPGRRPSGIVAIVRPGLAEQLTEEIAVQNEGES